MSLPTEIAPVPLVDANQNIENMLVELRPVNSTGANEFSSSDRITFQIPVDP